jgi:hypothetical protein
LGPLDYIMSFLRYVLAALALLIDWVAGYAVIGTGMCIIFPLPGHEIIVGGAGWRCLPGTVIGLLAGVYHFRAMVRKKQRRISLL